MNSALLKLLAIALCIVLLSSLGVSAQDWPQWRGPNRDAKVVGFEAPKAWPKELTKKWKVTVGDGVATPALVGDKLYVFTLQGNNEIIRCLDAGTGKEIWQDKYEAKGADGPAKGFAGPRASPTVADGKVVLLGVRGTVSCYDAASGKKLWRKDDIKGWPMFYTSSSPIIESGACVVQLGGRNNGALVAYDLATGNEKWKWTGDGTAYASPSLLSVGGDKVIVAETDNNIVGINFADGKQLWKTPFSVPGGTRGYNAASPMVDGKTVILSGSARGVRAVEAEKKADKLETKELWSNKDNSTQYNTPVLKNGLIFGLSNSDKLFCIDAKSGKTAWTKALSGGKGYGSTLDLGPAIMALTPAGQLMVYEPTDKEYKEIAKYTVADGGTYAYPVVAGKRIYVKDKDSVTLYTIE